MLKLTAYKDEGLDDDYVDIRYREMTPLISRLMEFCQEPATMLLCEKDGSTHKLDINDILYIEWVDNKSFVYTKSDVYTIASPLHRLEEALRRRHFFRISKMTLVNLFKLDAVSNGLNYRLTATMSNGESVIVSRHYRGALLKAIHALAREVAK